jgi:cell division protein FtsB
MKFFSGLYALLYKPRKVFLLAFVFAVGSLLLNGTFLRLYKLRRDHQTLQMQIVETRQTIADLNRKMVLAKDPDFIQRTAMDRYDLVDENDLVFVFADEAN